MGPIFCQIIKIREIFHFKFSITIGNQKWNGAAPILIKIGKIINVIIIWLLNFSIKFIIIKKNRVAEASAWNKK